MTQVGRNRRRVFSHSSGILNGFNLRDMMDERYMVVRRFLYRIRRDISVDFHLLDWRFLEPSEDIEESGEYTDLHMIIYDCNSLKYNHGRVCAGVNINVIGKANTVDISDVGGTDDDRDTQRHINKATIYLATRRNVEVDNCDGFIFNPNKVEYRSKYCRQLRSEGAITGYNIIYGHINYDKLREKT